MDAPTFINKWSKANLSEQAASHEHFLDLCRLLGVKTPAELDPVGDTFTFEKGAKVSAPASLGSKGDRGRADVWYKGRFAWESVHNRGSLQRSPGVWLRLPSVSICGFRAC